jgi:hypothetical protein
MKAQKFAEAFAGCDEWVIPPRKRRSSSTELFDAEALSMRPLPTPPGIRSDYRRAA